MIWFNIKKLEKKFAEGKVSDEAGAYYLMANLLLYTLVMFVPQDDYLNYTILWIEVILSILVTVMSVRVTFDINKKGDGRDYFKRFLGLSFVISVRLMLFVALAVIALTIVIFIVSPSPDLDFRNEDILTAGFTIAFTIVYYLMLVGSFRRINSMKNDEEQSPAP